VPDLTLRLLVLDLEIGERREAARAPVDEPLGAIDQPLVIETHEGFAHRHREPLVHGEARAIPIEGRAHDLELLVDAVAVLLLPRPDAREKFLAAEIVTALLLERRDPPLDHQLRRDARVIRPGQPHRVVGAHAPPADEDVLDGHRQRVAHVQRAGHVRRRDDDRVRRFRRGRVGVEIALLEPEAIPLLLDLRWVV
jgi:hypothetical protein